MTKFKRVCISIDENLHNEMKKTANQMGMTLSSWIKFIARDKIGYFKRNWTKYYVQPLDKKYEELPEDEEEDISEEEFEALFTGDRK